MADPEGRHGRQDPPFPAVTEAVERWTDRVGTEPDASVRVPATELIELYRRMESRPPIDQAKGILMGHYGLDEDQAFQVLRRWSQTANVKIRDLAGLLIGSVDGRPSSRTPPHELIERLRSGQPPEPH